MESTAREIHIREAAILLVYTMNRLDREIPDWIHDEADDMYAKDERVVAILCETLRNMEEGDRDLFIYADVRNKLSRQLMDWWEEHQDVDVQRIKKEANKRLKGIAMSKLNDDEKRILGLI
jgi:hypothetical protein